MQFIQGSNRHQAYFTTLEEQISADNAVRPIDAFVDKLDLHKLGFASTVHKSEGRPPYAPSILLKLYLCGYLNKIRSSRTVKNECRRNVEVQWLLQSLRPNYCTIADFRKLHTKSLQSMFILYIQFLGDAELLGKTTISVDGSNFKAVNCKKNNYTQKKIDKHQPFIQDKTTKYLQEINEVDKLENKLPNDEIQIRKVAGAIKRGIIKIIYRQNTELDFKRLYLSLFIKAV